MADWQFVDPRLAGLYDLWAPPEERDDLGFYLPLVMAAGTVLDIGCGTGARQYCSSARRDPPGSPGLH